MIEIINAAQWFVGIRSNGGLGPDCLVLPVEPYTRQQVQRGTLYQGNTYGNEKDVTHYNCDGTLYSSQHLRFYGDIYSIVDRIYHYADTTDGIHHLDSISYTVGNGFINDHFDLTGFLSTRWIYTLNPLYHDGTYDATCIHWDKKTGQEMRWVYPTLGTLHKGDSTDNVDPMRYIPSEGTLRTLLSEEGKEDVGVIMSDLFRECCNGIAPLDTNNIANLIDLIQCFKGISGIVKTLATKKGALARFFDPKKILQYLDSDVVPEKIIKSGVDTKKAANAWLAYRYAYCTTKSDYETLHSHFSSSWKAFQNWNKQTNYCMHATGASESTVYNMTVRMSPQCWNDLETLWVKSKLLGLQLNAVNVWDLVPFSFVVDWFLPIEDLLSVADDAATFNETHFVFHSIVFSGKTTKTINTPCGSLNCTYYHRYSLLHPPALQYADEDDPSTKTKVFRAMDGVSLVVGRL